MDLTFVTELYATIPMHWCCSVSQVRHPKEEKYRHALFSLGMREEGASLMVP